MIYDDNGRRTHIATILFIFLIAAPAPARDDGISRVQVIAPSTPLVDTYTPVTLVARTESGEIDRDFVGDIWLWTTGPWIRPFHVAFTAKEEGVITLPLKFSLPVLQRIETYTPGGVHHTWSNPVMAKEADYKGKRLFWGMMGECDGPGLDFCFTHSEPDSQTHELKSRQWMKQRFSLLMETAPLRSRIPTESGYLGVWAEDKDRESIWNVINKGEEVYVSWRSRIIIDWEWGPPGGEGKKGVLKVKVAGHGPREEVSIWKAEKEALEEVLAEQTDDYYLELEYGDARKGSRYFIIVIEPGSARDSVAVAGPLRAFP